MAGFVLSSCSERLAQESVLQGAASDLADVGGLGDLGALHGLEAGLAALGQRLELRTHELSTLQNLSIGLASTTDMHELIDDPQVAAMGYLSTVEHPRLGESGFFLQLERVVDVRLVADLHRDADGAFRSMRLMSMLRREWAAQS